jgi:cytochrome P450
MRPFMQRRYGNIIKKYVRKEIQARFLELKSGSTLGRKKAQSVISLALDAYISSKSDTQGVFPAALDESFVETVINQVRLFLFAGNDTTSSTIAFCFHSLAKYPACRAQMKKEHEALFGDKNAAQMLKDNPTLLNQCPYTNAFIKETLRLYPPAANMRRGQPEKNLTALNGQVVQTEGFNIICVQQAVHENPRIWIRPQEFIPERWLVDPQHELHPPANGYRPFDVGPRTCIGLPLTMAEIKIVLLLAVRAFDIKPAYEEWDRVQAQSFWQKVPKWFGAEEINTVYGDRAYQSEKAGTHPSSGYPCVVSLAGADRI